MIHTYIPYAPSSYHMNLGWTYNNFMKMIGDDDWACFLDHDATFTTRDWYLQLEDILDLYDNEYGLFTCMTNRIFMDYQKTGDSNSHDMKHHREYGKNVKRAFNTRVDDLDNRNKLLSGVVILISKKTWKSIGGFANGFLGVDNKLHLDCLNNDIKVGLMRGVYVYHWYRGDGDRYHLAEANKLNKNPMRNL